MSRHAKASSANREAEDRAARRVFDKTGGADSTDRDLGKDDMSDQIVLGGIHQPQPPAVIYPPAVPQKQGLGPMASALMAMAVPAAGAAGYIYQQEQKSEPVVAQPAEDESVRIRLGSIDNVEED